jgi:type IV secretory pathway VirB2 component (pilin)
MRVLKSLKKIKTIKAMQKKQTMQKRLRRCTRYKGALLALLLPMSARASGLGGDGGFDLVNVLQNLCSMLQGPLARVLLGLGIIGVGYATFINPMMGKKKGISVIIGIGIVFSATYIGSKLFGS